MLDETLLYNTYAQVDLDRIAHNYREIRNILAPTTELMCIVKANAYGHGAVEVARVLAREGASMLGVATIAEGIELREAGIALPILVLGGIQEQHVEAVVDYSLSQTVTNREVLQRLSEYAQQSGKTPKVHIKIDTGMGRLGIRPGKELDSFLPVLKKCRNIEVEGVYTHFAASEDTDRSYTNLQMRRFKSAFKAFDEAGIKYKYRHCYNSAAIINHPELHTVFNLVRPGLILYGYYPCDTWLKFINLKPVMQVKTKITFVKTIHPGDSVGYGRTFIADRATKVATIGIGYADGYSRRLSNVGYAIVKGKKVPLIGRISMDQCCLDVSEVEDVKLGDVVTLIGEDGEASIWANDIAEMFGAIAAEVLTALGRRVLRTYK
ncbi:MAG TPA: alanine racemase, partial [Negativicutes bacterium]|nr:alanine racemase [Negativicutes bacterium]